MQNKYNRTQKQDLRDSIFGLSRQMTRNPKKRAWKTKKTQRKRMANMEFSTSFSFVQIGVESTASAKQQKMRMVPQVPNGNKNFFFAVLRGSAGSMFFLGWVESAFCGGRIGCLEGRNVRRPFSSGHAVQCTQDAWEMLPVHQHRRVVCEPVCPLVPRCPDCPLT